MTIEMQQIQAQDGGLVTLPTVQYQINPVQFVQIIGWTGPDEAIGMSDSLDGGVANWVPLGRVAELAFPLNYVIPNSLKRSEWNFETYPNPLVFLGTLIGDETPPFEELPTPAKDLLNSLIDTVQQGARQREVERQGDPGLMTEMSELIREQPGSASIPTFRQAVHQLTSEYLQENTVPVSSEGLMLGAAISAYLNDDLQEGDLMELVDTDRERVLLYGIIIEHWVTYYCDKSARLDHDPGMLVPELHAQGVTTQAQFDAFLQTLLDEQTDPADE